jgi:hypothetical protein
MPVDDPAVPGVVVSNEVVRQPVASWQMGSIVRCFAVAVLAGIVTGVLTLAGQSVLPGAWNRLANSGAIWVSVAFAVATLAPSMRVAAVGGLLTLLSAVAGYDAAVTVAHAGVSTSSLAIWGGVAIVGGPVFGVAGRAWHVGGRRDRIVAAALLGAVYVAEGVFTLGWVPEMATAGWVSVVVGFVLPLLLTRDRRERLAAEASLVPLAALGVLGYLVIDRVFLLA